MITLQSKRYSLEAYNGTLDSRYPDGDQIGTLYPEEPRYTVDTTYSLPTGNEWTVTNTSAASVAGTGTGNRTDCSLLYALTNCERNDIITLTAGATYSGNYTLPSKTGTGWVYLRSSGHASLPAAGSRVVAADATYMARIQGSSGVPLQSGVSASHWRIIGIELCLPADTWYGNFRCVWDATSSYITLDRCYIRGDAVYGGAVGVQLRGSYQAVIGCRIEFCAQGEQGVSSQERQAILAYTGGPYKIENNYLSAGGECLMFGGGSLGGIDSEGATSGILHDVEILGNHLTIPTSWAKNSSDFSSGDRYTVKNLLEFKTGWRILVQGNLLENMWSGQGQDGTALLITPRNQGGGDPWNSVRDITIRYNKLWNVCAGINVAGGDGDSPTYYQVAHTDRILIEHNVLKLNGWVATATPGAFTVAQSAIKTIAVGVGNTLNTDGVPGNNYTLRYNTFAWDSSISPVSSGRIGYWSGSGAAWQASSIIVEDNIFHFGLYGIGHSSNGSTGTAALDYLSSAWTFANNGMYPISGVSASYPETTLFQSTSAGVAFEDYAAGDYRLAAGSPWKTASTTGSDLGCDIATLESYLND